MAINIDIPQPIEDVLRGEWGDLDRAAKEALIIESYRQGKVSLGYVAEVLGFATSIEAQQWLAQRKVPVNYELSDLEADRETLDKRTKKSN